MNDAYLLLGANLGDRLSQLEKAVSLIAQQVGTVTQRSAIYETEPWGIEDEQPTYLNMSVQVLTPLSPHELLEMILRIEESLGRIRKEKWGARVIDIDILFYNDAFINDPGLIIPHPFLHLRKFVLVPLADIAGEKIHPTLKLSIHELLLALDDPLVVQPYIMTNKIPTHMETTYKHLHPDVLIDWTKGDTEAASDMIQLFLTQTPIDIDALCVYLENEDWLGVAAQAHHIKPTFKYVGADTLHEDVKTIERIAKGGGDRSTLAELCKNLQQALDDFYEDLNTYLRTLGK